MTREAIRAALTDEHALVCTLYGEAAGETLQSQVAVACVVRNRVLADLGGDKKPDWWGEGYVGVCLKAWQFSCWWEDNANATRVYALAEALIARQPVGEPSLIAELRWIAAGIIGQQIRDTTRGADHYVTSALYRAAPPKWALLSNGQKRAPVCAIGAHLFFRLSQPTGGADA